MKRNNLLALAIILLVFLALQIVPILNVSVAQYDESIFLDVARNIRQTGLPLRRIGLEGQLFDQTPLYPYMLSAMTLFFGENLALLRLTTIAAAAGCIVLAYLIGVRASSRAAGIVAAALIALNPFFNLYSYFLRMEVFAALCLLLATYFMATPDRKLTGKQAGLAGLAIAAAVLFKIVTITYLMAALLWAFVQLRRSSGLWRRLAFLTIPTVAGLAVWVLILQSGTDISVTVNRYQAALGLTTTVLDARQTVGQLRWLGTMAGMVLRWETVLLLIIALFAYAWRFRRQPPIAHLLVLYLGLTIGLSLLASLKEPRHMFFLIPASALLIGICVDWANIWQRVRESPGFTLAAVVGAIILLWGLSPLKLPPRSDASVAEMWWVDIVRDRYFHNDEKLNPLRDAGMYIEASSPEDTYVAVGRQGPIIGFYAGRDYNFMYHNPFEVNMALLAEIDVLVWDPPVNFWVQSPEENQELLQYITDNFDEERVFSEGTGIATVYRRKP